MECTSVGRKTETKRDKDCETARRPRETETAKLLGDQERQKL